MPLRVHRRLTLGQKLRIGALFVVLFIGGVWATDPQARMTHCQSQADKRGGAERKAFVDECLKTPSPAEKTASARAAKLGAALGMSAIPPEASRST